jgi:uncharacterized small protein (DUF1192 family)
VSPGDVVEADDWRNVRVLVSTRYLTPVTVGPASSDGDLALEARVAELEERIAAMEAKPKRVRRTNAQIAADAVASVEH